MTTKEPPYEIGSRLGAAGVAGRRERNIALSAARHNVTAEVVAEFERGFQEGRRLALQAAAEKERERIAPCMDEARRLAALEADEDATAEEIEERAVEIATADADQAEQEADDEAERAAEEARERARDEERRRQARDPHCIRRHLEIRADYARGMLNSPYNDRREKAALRADLQALEAHDWLLAQGWAVECRSGSSVYYQRGEDRLRVSDHQVPETAERAWEREQGRFTWAGGCADEIVLPVSDLAAELRPFGDDAQTEGE